MNREDFKLKVKRLLDETATKLNYIDALVKENLLSHVDATKRRNEYMKFIKSANEIAMKRPNDLIYVKEEVIYQRKYNEIADLHYKLDEYIEELIRIHHVNAYADHLKQDLFDVAETQVKIENRERSDKHQLGLLIKGLEEYQGKLKNKISELKYNLENLKNSI